MIVRANLARCDSTLRRVAHRVWDAGRTLGVLRLVGTAPRWLVRREFLVTLKDLTGPLPPRPSSSGLVWRRLTVAEVSRLLAGSPTLAAAEVWRRLHEGQECWVAWRGDLPAHWRWETTSEATVPYLRRAVQPLDGDLWVVDVYTTPSQRRRGLYTAATVAAMHRARELGYRRFIGLIAVWNRPVRRIAEGELQRSVVGTVGYWALGRWSLPFTTGNVRLDENGRVYVPLDARAHLSTSVA